MAAAPDRLDLRLSTEDKERLRRAAAMRGLPVATFVREAALREAESVVAQPKSRGSLSARLRGRASARLSTDEIMRLTRGA